jgi:fucose 4-O-acetylase-like acetyltransferase
MENTRDKHVDVMLFWGIIFVVMGHFYQLPYFFFPAYTFHMALFFFISGYLFKVKKTVREKITFIIKKIKKQLLTFFLMNLFFGFISYVLILKGINLTRGGINLHNFFIEPFISNHQFYLNIPNWFLFDLFVINIISQLILFKDSKKLKIIIFLITIPIAIFAVYKGLNKYVDFRLTAVRICYGLSFFFVGILFNEFKKDIIRLFSSPLLIMFLWSIVVLLKTSFGEIGYAIVWGSVLNTFYYIPLITTLIIVFISYIICYYISLIIKKDSAILIIGQNTFYIMALHLSIFFLINLIFYFFDKIDFPTLSKRYFFFEREKFFLIYEIPAIVLPTVLGVFISKVKSKFSKNE